MNVAETMPPTAKKGEPTIEQLWARPDVTLTEATRITGRSAKTIAKWVKDREVRSFVDGKYVRILTASIRERSARLAEEQSGGGQY